MDLFFVSLLPSFSLSRAFNTSQDISLLHFLSVALDLRSLRLAFLLILRSGDSFIVHFFYLFFCLDLAFYSNHL